MLKLMYSGDLMLYRIGKLLSGTADADGVCVRLCVQRGETEGSTESGASRW